MSCSGLRSVSPWFNYRPADGPFCVRFFRDFLLYSSSNIVGEQIEDDDISGACATCWENRNAYRVLVRTTEDKKVVVRPRRRWENNIKIYLKEMGSQVLKWIRLA